ncbi:MAG: lamin tail domain-containing protein, partial [Verrucomicrobiaceae bacterium]
MGLAPTERRVSTGCSVRSVASQRVQGTDAPIEEVPGSVGRLLYEPPCWFMESEFGNGQIVSTFASPPMRALPAVRLAVFLLALTFLRPACAEQVVFSEIMYNPPANKPEFVEVWNITRTPLDMGKWHFTDGISFEFPDFNASSPQAVFLRAGERILLSAADEATTRAAYPKIPASVRVFGPWGGALASEGERLTLSDRNNVPVCTVEFREQSPWPKAADGTGHSLILRNENRMIDDFRVWGASFRNGGSPGLPDTGLPPPAPVRLSEVSFSAEGKVEWVEL